MKRPTDLLAYDPQSEAEGKGNCSATMQCEEQPESSASRTGGFVRTEDNAFEYGQAIAGLADAIKARNRTARRQGVRPQDKARARSRSKLSKALTKIFDEQGETGQDDVVVRRPVKKPEDV